MGNSKTQFSTFILISCLFSNICKFFFTFFIWHCSELVKMTEKASQCRTKELCCIFALINCIVQCINCHQQKLLKMVGRLYGCWEELREGIERGNPGDGVSIWDGAVYVIGHSVRTMRFALIYRRHYAISSVAPLFSFLFGKLLARFRAFWTDPIFGGCGNEKAILVDHSLNPKYRQLRIVWDLFSEKMFAREKDWPLISKRIFSLNEIAFYPENWGKLVNNPILST